MMTIIITGAVLLAYFDLAERFLIVFEELSFVPKMLISFGILATVIQDVAEIKKNLSRP